MHNNMSNIESTKGEIVMYQPDETIRLEVRVESETVWLTQQQMAELFKATKQNVSLHIRNIYDEGELDEISTVKDYLTVRKEGKRNVRRHVNLYNLDVIISVGYRVKSIRDMHHSAQSRSFPDYRRCGIHLYLVFRSI